jgi:hypothetical protein
MSKQHDLNVYITHFVPPKSSLGNLIYSFFRPRMSISYCRSWVRLLKHGTRGNQPWKKDVMTWSRKQDQINRMVYLSRLLESLGNLNTKSLTVNIFTNSNSAVQAISELGFQVNLKFHVYPQYNKMNQLNNSPWKENDPKSPWNLVWEHKKFLSDDYKKGNKNSLYLYIENDLLFTQKNLEYWLEHKTKLNKFRLIPSFMLIEYSQKLNKWVPINLMAEGGVDTTSCPKIKANKNLYLQLPNPYTGLYLLDQQMLKVHLNSSAFLKSDSKKLTWWDLGARAASGNQFIGVPKGFNSRNVITLDSQTLIPAPGVLIHHMPNLYTKTLGLEAEGLDLDRVFY